MGGKALRTVDWGCVGVKHGEGLSRSEPNRYVCWLVHARSVPDTHNDKVVDMFGVNSDGVEGCWFPCE